MDKLLADIRPGLALVMLSLIFGIGLGVAFGVNEDAFKDYVAKGIATHSERHDAKSQSKIWRYAQRAHFHSTGIAAFSLGLLLLTGATRLSPSRKKLTSILIGLGGLYPLAWLNMYRLAPSLGRDGAHQHLLTEALVYIGTGGLLLGILLLTIGLLRN